MPDPYRRRSLSKWLVPAFALTLATALVPARAALANPPGDNAAGTARAKELFEQGTTLFNVGEFDKAIEAWQAGYKEKPDPGFLYNIGQAYRLKGDSQKAIFFYRGYLRNSPKAVNRADVEAKIAQLQKAVNEGKPGTPTTTPPAPPPAPIASPPPTRPAPVTPPPTVTAPPPPTHRPEPVAPPPMEAPPLAGPPPVVEVTASPPPAPPLAPLRNRPIDFGFALGFDSWTSGIRGKAQPSFALDLAVGYTLGDVYGSSSFRLGARLAATSLKETGNKVDFTSLLAEPSVRIRLIQRRLFLTGALGMGALFISNIKNTSTLLVQPPTGQTLMVNGTQAVFELRPAAGLMFHIVPAMAASVTPALSFSPKKENFYQALGRFELMFGLSFFI